MAFLLKLPIFFLFLNLLPGRGLWSYTDTLKEAMKILLWFPRDVGTSCVNLNRLVSLLNLPFQGKFIPLPQCFLEQKDLGVLQKQITLQGD